MLIAGLMSGTSRDGIDAALVRIGGAGEDDLSWELVHFRDHSFKPERREALDRAIRNGSPAALCDVHADLGEWFAEAVVALCEEAGVPLDEVDAVGSHGQTIWHRAPADGRRGATLQLGCPATIAERTGRTVVSDFRTRDMAAGGHGAPLVPFADRLLFARADGARALQNIGGIGNITRVPPRGSGEPVLAFDSGPGNALIDAAVERASGGTERYDRDGVRARSGTVDEDLLAELLAHPYFEQAPPKSTGREMFGSSLVESIVQKRRPAGEADWCDLAATLTELTARSIADAVRWWILPAGVEELVVTGGGARNPVLMERLRDLLDPLPVRDGSVLGIDPAAKEAVAFALLAWAHLVRIPSNEPAATGARGRRVLGSVTPGGLDSEHRAPGAGG